MTPAKQSIPSHDAAPGSTLDALVGRRIAAARHTVGLTVRELAVMLGWPHTTLNNYETGRRPIPLLRLGVIAQALGQPPAAFLVETSEESALIAVLAGNLDTCLQIRLVLDALDEPLPDPPL